MSGITTAGAEDQPPHSLLKTQHQGKNSDRELAEISEISQGRTDQGIPSEKPIGQPVRCSCWNELKGELMQD
jgi:hypothetical protein